MTSVALGLTQGGHLGSITTIRASSAAAAVEQLMLMMRQSAARAGLTHEDIHALVHNLIMQTDHKCVTEIAFLAGKKRGEKGKKTANMA